jgi:beta-glucosidase
MFASQKAWRASQKAWRASQKAWRASQKAWRASLFAQKINQTNQNNINKKIIIMKKIQFWTLAMGICIPTYAADPQLGKATVDEVLAALTLDEKAQLLVGTGMAGFGGSSPVVGATRSLVPGAAGTTYPIARLGIPAIVLADGPAGLRIAPTREGTAETFYCTAFPVATLLAATWNVELVENVGKAMGSEVLEYGADVLLAPALNIHRNPLCGRSFEYYSEDPLLSGKITAAMVRGVQSNGVGTSIKHFAANNQETNRMNNDARVSQRALREVYLKGFEIAVREAQPWTVMSSYNRINGTLASESRELLTTILRDEWGFRGAVMTDWFGGQSAPAQVHAGNDLLMPGRPDQKQAIVDAVNGGTLSREDLDANVRRVLQLVLQSPRFKGYKFSSKPDLKAHADVTRRSAAEGMVLLKNEAALPLPAELKSVAAFGITSYDFIAGGSGSGDVNEAYTISLGEGLSNAGYRNHAGLQAMYAKHIAAENEKNKPDPSNPMAAFLPKLRPVEILPDAELMQAAARDAEVALVAIGRTSGEFADRKVPNDFDLSQAEQTLLSEVCRTFHAVKKKVVVILNIGGVIETSSWKSQPDAILLAWQAGQEGGNTVADVLCGKVNPSGKLPMTFPLAYGDAASSANFPADYTPDPNAWMGAPSTGKAPVRNVDFTDYDEGIYVGYRYFDSFGKAVSYPFGYGLSYTTFDISAPVVKESSGAYTISISVKNTGKLAGKEVVQLYVSAPANAALPKPTRELKAFAKTKILQPNESQTLDLRLTPLDLASFSEAESAWLTDAGTYTLRVNASNKAGELKIATSVANKVSNALAPKEKIAELKKK